MRPACTSPQTACGGCSVPGSTYGSLSRVDVFVLHVDWNVFGGAPPSSIGRSDRVEATSAREGKACREFRQRLSGRPSSELSH